MPRIKPQIIDEYAKIAEERGLIKLAEKDSKELQEYKNSTEARMGSDSIAAIEVLYGVKPEQIYSKEYEQNIMEIAHPNAVVIAPAYDKINGLVTNEIEHHNIMSNIALKPNNGLLTNHKYAHKELTMELVRLANELDARNMDDLRTLADSCLIELSARQRQSLKKTAIAPIAIAGIAAAIAVALGATWLASNTANPDQGLLNNAHKAVSALTELKTNSWHESDVDSAVQAEADKLIRLITELTKNISEFNSVVDMVTAPKTMNELEEFVKVHDDKLKSKETEGAIERFKKAVLNIKPLLEQSIDNFSSEEYQKRHTKPSWLAEHTGWFGEVLHGKSGLIANDYQSAVNALIPLKKSLEAAAQRFFKFDAVVQKYKDQILSLNKTPISSDSGSSSIVGDKVEPPKSLNEKYTADKSQEDKIKEMLHREPTPEEEDFFNFLKRD